MGGSDKVSGEGENVFRDPAGMLTSTMNDVPGHEVKAVLGTVYGLICKSPSVGASTKSMFRAAAGGEMKTYSTLMYTSRNAALDRLIGEARARGANAIIALRFETNTIMEGIIQVAAYGTACVIEKRPSV